MPREEHRDHQPPDLHGRVAGRDRGHRLADARRAGAAGAQARELRSADPRDLDRRDHAVDARGCQAQQQSAHRAPVPGDAARRPAAGSLSPGGAGDLRHHLHAARLHVGRVPDDGADRAARHRRERRRRHAQDLETVRQVSRARLQGHQGADAVEFRLGEPDEPGEADPHARRPQRHAHPHAVGGAVGAARGARRHPDRYAGEPDLQQPRSRRDRCEHDPDVGGARLQADRGGRSISPSTRRSGVRRSWSR